MRTRANVRTEPKEIFDRQVTCDRCGTVIDSRGYNVFDITIEAEHGTSYPEGSYTSEMVVDCCPACWPAAVQALEAAGFTFHQYDGQYFEASKGWPSEEPLDRSRWGLS